MMDDLRKTINGLSEERAKSFLFHILHQIKLMKTAPEAQEKMLEKLFFLSDNIEGAMNRNFEREYKTVHLVCGESQAGSLKVGLDRENRVIGFPDFFAEGPIWELHKEVGQKHRHEWLQDHLTYHNDYFEEEYQKRFLKTLAEIESIPEHLPIVIWTAENANEQTGLRYFMYLLKEKPNEVFVVNTTLSYQDLFHSNELYEEVHTGEVHPEKLNLIFQKTVTQPLSTEEKITFEEEWVELSHSEDIVRIWENNKIIAATEDSFDELIIRTAQKIHAKQSEKDFIKAGRIIGEVFAQIGSKVSDAFLEYRLRNLVYKGIFDIKGVPKGMRYYSVRIR
ncbi:DUF1835 domain-containing protein [Neobacillus sp. D3-1R]|uniref:DUF1835 domain-containing protein n=1 Tax=Neobacillus sp. D3-1R TaxID=3445778 RepID=UPI003F9F5363